MKFISYDLKNGKIRDGRYWFPTYLKEHQIEQVYELPNDDYYIIHINDIGFSAWFLRDIPHVNKKILEDIRDKKAVIVLNFDHYTFGLTPVHQRKGKVNIINFIKAFAKALNIDHKSLVYIDSNYKVESILKKHDLNGYWFNLWEYFLDTIDNPAEVTEKIINKEIREKKFLYFGGKARDYRLQFLNSCFKIENFKDNSFVSTSEGSFIDSETKESKWMPAHVLDLPDINGGGKQDEVEKINEYYHLNSYINIVAMSHFYWSHDQLEVNEKLFKPISTMQPFIILGQAGTLSVLKDLGYKTFDKWIDESYDNCMDHERYHKILAEVARLSKLTHKELADMLHDMLPVLIHNFELKKQRTRTHSPELLNKIVSAFNHNT